MALFDFEAGEAELYAADYRGDVGLEVGSRLSLTPFGVETLRRGDVRIIEDVREMEDAPALIQELRAQGVRSIANVPLQAHGTLIGSLNLASDRAAAFTAGHLEIAREAADSLAVALHQARLVEVQRAQLLLTRTLQEMGALLTSELGLEAVLEKILDLLARVVEYDSALVLLVTDGQFELAAARGVPSVEASAGTVRQVGDRLIARLSGNAPPAEAPAPGKGKALVIPETATDDEWVVTSSSEHIRSWVGAPLSVKGRLIGALNVNSHVPDASTMKPARR